MTPGHTFLGHSGEWWISNKKEDLGLGYYCHNALRTKRPNLPKKNLPRNLNQNQRKRRKHII